MGCMKEYMQDLEAERFDEWLEENYPTLKNGSRPRTCTAGSRKRWPIRLSGNMNTGSLWLP